MKINLEVDPDSPFAYSINSELARENKELKEQLMKKTQPKTTKKKIVVKGIKKKRTNNVVVAKFGNKVLNIHYEKKDEIKRGYFSDNLPNIEELIEKKVLEMIKRKSKISLYNIF